MPSKQRVYIGNLGPDCRERDLEKLFRDFGRLGEVIIRNDFGFVDFDDYHDADDAVSELDGKEFLGRRLRVELAKGDREKNFQRDRGSRDHYRSPPRNGRNGHGGRWSGPPGRTPRTQWRVLVENIASKTCWQELKDYFRTAGDVNYCTANKIAYGVGMVEFTDRRGMERAVDKFDNTEFDGNIIRVNPEGGRGLGGGRSRSRSPVKRRSGSSLNRRSRTPTKRRSRSPNRRSRSPANHKSRSPANHKSRSPANRRSRSPNRKSRSPNRKSRSPVNRRSRSPANRRTRSRSNRRSKSPVNDRARSPKRRSRSPSTRKSSRSPTERRSRSSDHAKSKSPVKNNSRSPRVKTEFK